jgi:uncharacterized membrane-anchored protein
MIDYINGTFEFLAGFMILNHCRQVVRDKQVKGVSLVSTAFFALWGMWNLYYYPALDQWVSFFGGMLIMLANTLWIVLMIRYRAAPAPAFPALPAVAVCPGCAAQLQLCFDPVDGVSVPHYHCASCDDDLMLVDSLRHMEEQEA